MQGGSTIHLMWHSSYRYPRRDATKVVKLVEEYSDPNIAGAIGLQGEALILEGFARHEFVMRGRNSASYGGKKWESTEHNLDFIFERDGRAYGVEVKNTLGYMDFEVLQRKIIICKTLGLKPVFAARMLPKTWIHIVNQNGGFGLVFKYQLYPWAHKGLAKRVAQELGLPVDAPRALAAATMERFVRWHEKL